MGLQFYLGGSGAGKSWKLHQDIIAWSLREPDTRFLFVVPDQFTMHTQMELVRAHPRRGILNIDVLSFGRLSHRIFEETGGHSKKILDDTGKSLVLRKIAASLQENLPVIGKNLTRPGYIHEIKSAVSELIQYGIGPDILGQMVVFAEKRGALSAKLRDLEQIYRAFMDYIKEEFITAEETLDRLRAVLHRSEIIRDSVVVLDGFTGFTPLQNKVIQELMIWASRVIVSVIIGKEADPFGKMKEQELFYLSGKMIKDLCSLAKDAGIAREQDVYLRPSCPPRFAGGGEIAHLEQHLFRFPLTVYEGEHRAITLFEASGIREEVRQACIKIRELTLNQGIAYREIGVVTGDLNAYGGYLEREAGKYGIPLYLDRTRGIMLNPFTEFLRSALRVVVNHYSYEAVFHYLRSGFSDCTTEEIDCLENYVIGCGIKGRKRWHSVFVRRGRQWEDGKQAELLKEINAAREKVIKQLTPLEKKHATVGEMIRALYDFIVEGRIQHKLKVYEEYFLHKDDFIRAREYGQIYRLVMELLDQIHALLADETMSLREFADILDAGLGEIQVGTIPQNVDRVVVGDMERTRLSHIKVLFFLGVNDGIIPAGSSKGGLISDLDREFLKSSQWELAPAPRQQMYIQRLYLYIHMTKPSEHLYLSWAKVDSEGKSLRPSYLIETIRKMFPLLHPEQPELKEWSEQVTGVDDSWDFFTDMLRNYASGSRESRKADFDSLVLLGRLYEEQAKDRQKRAALTDAAFISYTPYSLGKAIADTLYGSLLEHSVSRLEQYAACAYAHFLQYGLALREREEYSFEAVDLGNIFHGVLELFAGKLAEQHISWFDFSEEEGLDILQEAIQSYAAEYGETILFSSARNEHMIGRIKRILARTVRTLQQQLRQGLFTPERFEVAFSRSDRLESVNIALSEDEEMRLRGRIDRIDTYEDEKHVYVKVIDYKSGNKRFDLAALYDGLQLQLVVYMNVAAEITGRTYPDKEIIPAALLYYHVSDPMIKEKGEMTPEIINQKILQELRMNGIISGKEEVIGLLDKEFLGKSLVVPAERNKDGSFSKRSGVLGEEELQLVSEYVNHKIRIFGLEIKSGVIAVSPYENKDGRACTYCAYRSICGYDAKIPGYQTRKLDNLPEDIVLQRIREELK